MEVKERRVSAISLPASGIETACAAIHVAQPRLDIPVRLDRKETPDLSTLVSSQNGLWRKCLLTLWCLSGPLKCFMKEAPRISSIHATTSHYSDKGCMSQKWKQRERGKIAQRKIKG